MTEETTPGLTVEVVRGHLTGERADQLLRFWSANGALEGEAARQRMAEVVCVLLDEAGEIAGVNSVHPDQAPLVGRRLWMYRSFILPAVTDAAPAMIATAFGALQAEFDADAGGPIGLCALISDPDLLRRHPEAFWPEVGLLYVGSAEDAQVRVAYFEGATV